jgi:hypothetical protein
MPLLIVGSLLFSTFTPQGKCCSQPRAAVAGNPVPASFHATQMQTIITKALSECEIKPVPSRRCFTVMCECSASLCVKIAPLSATAYLSFSSHALRTIPAWIQERLDSVYRQDPRYSDKAQTLFTLDLGPPEVCGRG